MKMNLHVLPLVLSLAAVIPASPAMAQAAAPAQTAVQTAVQTDNHAIQAKHRLQTSFASPDEAVSGLVSAMRDNNWKSMHAILGHEAARYVQSGDDAVNNDARTKFLAAFDEKSRIEMKGHALAVLHLGNDDWPLPFPLVKQNGKWHFDAKVGIREWQDRRIGADELSAIQIALAYVDAQREYVQANRKADGLPEYAQRIISTPGQHDGLYWPQGEGEALSPMGQAFAAASKAASVPGRLQSRPYHGYFFHILTAQGKAASGGELDYLIQGKLIGGFALIAYPAQYGESGIKTFIVNHEGIVYSKDLGAQTGTIAGNVERYDPDSSWKREAP